VGVATVWAQSTLVQLDRPTLVRWTAWLLLGFFGLFPGVVAYLVWAERKVAARFQDRVGPNRVGPFGLLQSVADGLKLVLKENLVPASADRVVHLVAPVLIVCSSFLVLAVIPFGPGLAPVNLPSGMVYLVAVSSLSPLGVFLAGWSSRNKFSLLGAMRSVAQLVSYEVPQVLATVPVVLWAGSLSLVTIVDRQYQGGWFVLSPPGLLAFATLLTASVAEVNRAPFDLPEAESEIVAGFHTEYSGMRFGLFFLAEYMNVLGVSCLAAVLFLGGGSLLPFPGLSGFPADLRDGSTAVTVLVASLAVAIFLGKVLGIIFVLFWVRATLPRVRVDRLMNFAWKYLVPLCVANILIAAVWFECVLRPGPSSGLLLGWMVTGPMTLFVVWFAVWLNARVGSAGGSPPSLSPGSRSLAP